MPAALRQITRDDLISFAVQANPRPVSEQDAREVLAAAF